MASGKNTVVTQKGIGQTYSTNAVTTETADRDRYSYRAEAVKHKDACPTQPLEIHTHNPPKGQQAWCTHGTAKQVTEHTKTI